MQKIKLILLICFLILSIQYIYALDQIEDVLKAISETPGARSACVFSPGYNESATSGEPWFEETMNLHGYVINNDTKEEISDSPDYATVENFRIIISSNSYGILHINTHASIEPGLEGLIVEVYLTENARNNKLDEYNNNPIYQGKIYAGQQTQEGYWPIGVYKAGINVWCKLNNSIIWAGACQSMNLADAFVDSAGSTKARNYLGMADCPNANDLRFRSDTFWYNRMGANFDPPFTVGNAAAGIGNLVPLFEDGVNGTAKDMVIYNRLSPSYSNMIPFPFSTISDTTPKISVNIHGETRIQTGAGMINVKIDGSPLMPIITPPQNSCNLLVGTLTDPLLGDGGHTVFVSSVDEFGLSSNTSWTFTIKQSSGGSVGGSSCPFLYVYNGEKYEFDNDIIPAGNPNKTKDYYLLMKSLIPKDNKYYLKLTEDMDEISSIDMVKLLQIDHPKGTKIAPTPDGKQILTYENPVSSVSAKDKQGRDLLKELSDDENGDYLGNKGDYILFEFKKDESVKHAKLILKSDLKYDPDKPPPCVEIQADEATPAQKSLHIKIFDGRKWDEVGVIHPHMKWDIYAVDISKIAKKIKTDKLKVKVEWTQKHKLDYCLLDMTENRPIAVTELPMIKAEHTKDGDVIKKLKKTDNDYAVTRLNDGIELEFPCYSEPKEERSFIFVSEGFYKPIKSKQLSMK